MHVLLTGACRMLLDGRVVAIPTETVYGLAASISHPKAIDQIFKLKNRPSNNPLIIHVKDRIDLSQYATSFPPGFEEIAETFWPGPLTMILPINKSSIPEIVRAGLSTAAFRVPSHPLAFELICRVGPLVMPSANLSGKPSATRWEHVVADFGEDFPVLDGGVCGHGIESTILNYREDKWEVVRLGAISPEALEPVLGYFPNVVTEMKKQICPGHGYRHYAPKANLILNKMPPEPTPEVVVGFTDRSYPTNCRLFALGTLENPKEAAERLYDILRKLDRKGIAEAWVDTDFPKRGLWATIHERLLKATSKA